MRHLLLAAAAVALVSAAPTPELGSFGIDTAGMDKAVLPGDDFYKYVNGGWDARTPIPADKAVFGEFDRLRDLSDSRTRALIEKPDARLPAPARKAALLYASFMDEAGIEAKGASPLKPELDRIAALSSPAALSAAFASANREGFNTPLRVGASIDAKDPDRYAVAIGQGGLGLPDRDYYLKDDARFVAARDAYRVHVGKMLALAGVADSEAKAKAKAIVALETEIAKVHWDRVQSRQAEKRYNPVAAADLAKRYPGVDWPAFLGAVKMGGEARVIVLHPSAIEGIARLAPSVPLQTWKDYLTYHMVASHADVLPRAFVDEDFAFQKVLNGTPELKARWKRGVDFVNDGMGDAVGEAYVARYFPPAAKAKADELVRNLLAAMRIRLEHLTWMAPETKQKALAKLASFRPKIGYTEVWRDYTGLQVVPGDAFGNEQRARRFDYDFDSNHLGKPADRREWHMTPQTVNAYANPVWNEVVFPAAILQPPFFDPNADPAVNYGGIGSVIGHEISHHFDDQGRKYDATGRLADWWTPEDIKRFKAYTDRVEAQYGAYEPLPGVHVNGGLTLGENMADLAGINVSHDAWLISLKGKPAPVIGGWTGEQRFFLGFGQVWRSKYRDAAMLKQLTTNPHTPGNWRPYVVRNVDAWYGAFGVKPGQKYYLAPADRIKVW